MIKRRISKERYRKISYAIILILVLIAINFGVKQVIRSFPEEDCVMQPTSCCSCEMGGKEECITLEKAETIKDQLEVECSKGMVCTANYVCEDVTCKIVDGVCKKE